MAAAEGPDGLGGGPNVVRIELRVASAERRAAALAAFEGSQDLRVCAEDGDVVVADDVEEPLSSHAVGVAWLAVDPGAATLPPRWDVHVGGAEGLPVRARICGVQRDDLATLAVVRAAAESTRRTVSHDLRTPVAVLLGQLELLEEGIREPLTPKQQASMVVMRRNVERLWAMADAMRAELASALGPLADGPTSLHDRGGPDSRP
jgi:signal transduction histidine kinase